MFKVIATETYQEEIDKWTKADRIAAEKVPSKLAINPYIGNSLGYPYLRERRIREKRIYYLVYDDLKLVMLVATSGKKDQQETINHIKGRLDEFRMIAEEIIKRLS